MSTSEPFLPAGEAPRDADPREHDIDDDVETDTNETDTNEQSGVDDPDATAAASEPNATFRTPRPGDRLSPDALADELDDDDTQ